MCSDKYLIDRGMKHLFQHSADCDCEKCNTCPDCGGSIYACVCSDFGIEEY